MKKSVLWIMSALALTASQGNTQESPASYVRPLIGTSGHGHTFPGASVPFGMVKLSPDTGNEGWDWCSGYHYSDSSIMGFSHTHLSGTGRGELLDVLLMPTTGKLQFEPGSKANPDEGYRSRFSHEKETAKAGYYSVHLDDCDVQAELTASTRAGFHRYTFEKKGQGNVIIDMAHSFKTDNILNGSIEIKEDTLIVGSHKSKGWGEGTEKYHVEHEVFFAARLSQPITGAVFHTDGTTDAKLRKSNGKSVKVGLTFDVSPEKPLLIKVGISGVDLEGALRNLDAEIPDWDFDKVVAASNQQWNKLLSGFDLKDKDEAAKETFHTAVYRASLAPFTANDVDGRYMGSDHKIQKAEGYTNLTGLSLWDTFRAANPLYTLIAPKVASDIVRSMLAQHDEYGLLPVWSLCNSETNCMIGYHSIPVIVDAYLKGITGFDAEKAFAAMKKSAMQDDFDIKHLKAYNYIPRDLAAHTSVAMTLEYAFDDYCIAVMAEKLGKKEDHAYFTKRSQAFKNLYDTSIGFMRGKDSKGEFRKDFDPYNAVNATSDFVEGNSWQYTWFVPHDIPALIAGMGGKEPFVKRLDELFSVSSKLDENTPKDVSGLIGQYAQGNEPSHHVAYLLNWGDTPWKTQERVSQICRELYTNKPDGLCGNEDMGQMSAWYVFSALGFYPVNPADGKYAFGTPLFEEVSMNLPNGKKFIIKANGHSKKNIYISKILLNGSPYEKGYLTHTDILKGGQIEFFMSDKPGMVFQMD
ncbi:MAG: glycoside hydrolase family 92 protein [Gloeobacteraceae cyanobacterium ES-bin-144]|nr:glycoside hydrolase family 92 protein [Verrucomicrobiales bacterium]